MSTDHDHDAERWDWLADPIRANFFRQPAERRVPRPAVEEEATVAPGAECLRPARWCELLGIEILDPDGWRNDEQPWDQPIGEAEFIARAAFCTQRIKPVPTPPRPEDDVKAEAAAEIAEAIRWFRASGNAVGDATFNEAIEKAAGVAEALARSSADNRKEGN